VSQSGASILLWAIARHFERDRDVEFLEPLFNQCVIGSAEALCAAIDPATRMPVASLDFWEERRGEPLSTAIAMEAGLRSAAELAAALGEWDRARVYGRAAGEIARGMLRDFHRPELGRFARAIARRDGRIVADPTLDASLLLLPLFGAFESEDPRVRSSHDAVRRRLWVKTGTGGLARYEDDPVDSVGTELADVPGNPWIMPTLWMGIHALRVARRAQDLDPTRTILLWCAARAGKSGHLAEHLHPYGGETKGIAPSMRTHAWFVWAVVDYVERMRDLSRCGRCGARSADRRRAVPGLPVEAPLPGIIAHK
jgi:GH15 family glucan-1,4-alpha-glucosidase